MVPLSLKECQHCREFAAAERDSLQYGCTHRISLKSINNFV